MTQKNTLKQTILQTLIFFTIVIVIITSGISIFSLYKSEIKTLKHNQIQVLSQTLTQTNIFLEDIEETAKYIESSYKKTPMLFKTIVDMNNNIGNIILLDKKGLIEDFYSSSEMNIFKGFDYSSKRYFKELSDKNEYWSNIFFSLMSEEQTITYSYKMKNEKIIVLYIKLSALSEFCKRFKNSDGSHMIRIFDENGIMILNPDRPDLIAQQYNAKDFSIYQDLIEKENEYEQSSFYSNLKNSKQIGMYVKNKKIDWTIVVRENYTFLLESLLGILMYITFIVVIFIVIAIYIALKIAKKIFGGIDKLNNNISEISAGNYDILIESTPYAEFDVFTNSFEKMQHEIEKREISLEQSLKNFKSLVNSTMEAIIIHEKGICKEVNDVAIKLFGYDKKDDMLDKPYESFISNKYIKTYQENKNVESTPFEIGFIRYDGSEFMSLTQEKILSVFGKVSKVSTIIDITEVKKKDKLLFQQNKMASMGEMIGNIAHQWRQPLSTISTAASGVKLHKELGILNDKDFDEALDSIVKSTKYLSKTIDDFRDFFKTNKNEEQFSLLSTVKNVLSLIGASFKNNEIVTIENFDEDIFVYGHQNELIQALLNILNNAKDALQNIDTDDRIVEITISSSNLYGIVTIKDSAGGIPSDIMPSIFEPYFTTKHKSQGTGIGLYMTHQIVVSHMKGDIKVENESFMYKDNLYNGACFTIYIPKSINNQT